MYYLLAFIILFGGVVIFHELGHFLAAKLLSIPVDEFAFGFGFKIFSKKFRGTFFSLRAIPIGGFVKISDEIMNTMKPWKKIIIVAMGPIFNFILAFFILFIVYSFYGTRIISNKISDVKHDSPAYNILKKNDKIIKIDNFRISNFGNIISIVEFNPNKKMNFEVIRNNKKENFEIKTGMTEQKTIQGSLPMGYLGIMSYPAKEIYPNTEKTTEIIYNKLFYLFYDNYKGIENVFMVKNDYKQMSGPIMITKIGGKLIINHQWKIFFVVMGFLSFILGIMNLLPIPVLDGGHIVRAFAFMITKKEMNEQVDKFLNFASLCLILLIFSFTALRDIINVIRY